VRMSIELFVPSSIVSVVGLAGVACRLLGIQAMWSETRPYAPSTRLSI
jgi:hypothetical protein